MTSIFRARRHAFALATTAVVAVTFGAADGASGAAPAKPVAPSPTVIPLPLNPVIAPQQRLCTASAASGLGSMTLKPAEGVKPAKADYVLVNYIGYLAANGEVFDQGMQAAFPVEGVIPGFSEGLQLMSKGSVWRFCIPATLGYGAQASGPIPANSALVFQVELVDFKTSAEIETMRAAQSAEQPAKQ